MDLPPIFTNEAKDTAPWHGERDGIIGADRVETTYQSHAVQRALHHPIIQGMKVKETKKGRPTPFSYPRLTFDKLKVNQAGGRFAMGDAKHLALALCAPAP